MIILITGLNNKPLQGSLLNNEYFNGKYPETSFFVAHVEAHPVRMEGSENLVRDMGESKILQDDSWGFEFPYL